MFLDRQACIRLAAEGSKEAVLGLYKAPFTAKPLIKSITTSAEDSGGKEERTAGAAEKAAGKVSRNMAASGGRAASFITSQPFRKNMSQQGERIHRGCPDIYYNK